jgi:hypothetical protein
MRFAEEAGLKPSNPFGLHSPTSLTGECALPIDCAALAHLAGQMGRELMRRPMEVSRP